MNQSFIERQHILKEMIKRIRVSFKKISRTEGFDRDLKKLSKKFKTLNEDLQTFINVGLMLFHNHKIDNGGIVQVSNLGITSSDIQIFKARKFACKAFS